MENEKLKYDILTSELDDTNILQILEFVQNENYKQMIFERNQYSIVKLNKNTIFVGDHIGNNYDCYEDADFTRKNIVITVSDYVEIIKKYAETIGFIV